MWYEGVKLSKCYHCAKFAIYAVQLIHNINVFTTLVQLAEQLASQLAQH